MRTFLIATANSSYGDTHNFFVEYFYRGGLVAISIVMLLFFYFAKVLSHAKTSATNVGAYIVLLSLMSVYAIGGLTHWPGTFSFWLILGALIGQSAPPNITGKQRNLRCHSGVSEIPR